MKIHNFKELQVWQKSMDLAVFTYQVSKKEFQHFISVAMGSSFELETQAILAFRFSYIQETQLADFETLVIPVQKMCFGLYNSLEN